MDSLNMSQLNLSTVRDTVPSESSKQFTETTSTETITSIETKYEVNPFTDPDNEYKCEYQEEIWKSLLEQDAEKPILQFQSPQLEFRGSLVEQLRNIAKKMNLSISTLHTAVAQLDLFMDAHRLRADRLTHVALACLSLAAKSEEKISRAPTLKTLSKVSGIELCGKTFRQLEWMVGQHAKWKLLTPTPVSYAALLAQFVVTDAELITRHPKFVRRFKRDGAKLLESYLDMTLSDVRLKVVESVEVGCACVACARAELGLSAWPGWLAARTARPATTIASLARLLFRMMQILRSRNNPEADQGYNSSNTTPNTSPTQLPFDTRQESYRTRPIADSYPVRSDFTISFDENGLNQYVQNKNYYRSLRLIDAMSSAPSSGMAVKRPIENNVEIERKRYRVTNQMSQAVL